MRTPPALWKKIRVEGGGTHGGRYQRDPILAPYPGGEYRRNVSNTGLVDFKGGGINGTPPLD
jgi:hypothetical protein